MLVGQLIVGGLVFTTVTVWLQVLLLPHWSFANQVRVTTNGHGPLLVTVLKTEMCK